MSINHDLNMSMIVVAVIVLAPFNGAVLIALVAVSIGLCVSRKKLLATQKELENLKLLPKREEVDGDNRLINNFASKRLPVPPSIAEEYEDVKNDYAEHTESGYRDLADGHYTIPTEVPKAEPTERQVVEPIASTPTEREYLEFIEEDPAQWEVTSHISYVGPDETTEVCQET